MKVFFKLLRYIKRYPLLLFSSLLFALTGSGLSILVPVFTGKAIDCLKGKETVDFESLKKILLILSGIIIFSALSQWIMGRCTTVLSNKTSCDLRKDLFRKFNSVPVSFIDSKSRGDLISRASNDAEAVSDALSQFFSQLFTGVVTIAGTLIFMLFINVKIALIVIVLTPLSLVAAAFIAKISHKEFTKQSEIRGKLSGFSEEMISNQNILRNFSSFREAEETFDEINRDFAFHGLRATFYSSVSNPLTRFINGVIYAFVALFGALRVINGKMTVGTLVSFLSYANQYTKPFNEISGVISELQNALSCAGRILDIIESENEPDDSSFPALENADGSISFENICFSYVPEKPLLTNININVENGQRIAIVGPTGCGKTTLINLLMRFYDTTSGNIIISGKNNREITRESLRNSFGMVLQDTWLFQGTVADNISYGKPDATNEEIINAAKAAHAHSFIKRLPNGYDTIISDTGCSLSQGQKQLLTIARIMLTDPPMLILDEATSSIDIRTEVMIRNTFEKMMKGKTSFIIAHRLSTIRNCDMILVMNFGNIIEQGTHEDLMSKHGFYHNLYTSALS